MSSSNNPAAATTATAARSVAISTHGKKLLQKLLQHQRREEQEEEEEDLEQQVLTFIKLDPIAGRYCHPDTGNNSFHVVLSTNGGEDFSLKVLSALIGACPEGLLKPNRAGYLPLHLHMLQPVVSVELIRCVLTTFPKAASLVDGEGFVPLFYCVMREDSSSDVCKLLCKTHPQGAATLNRTSSYPLHFAAKRRKPNLEILKILIRRNPAAASHVNSFGMLPIHCLCSSSNNINAVKLLVSAYPEGVMIPDRQGRLPLHQAVLEVGKVNRRLTLQDEMEKLALCEENESINVDQDSDLEDEQHSVPSTSHNDNSCINRAVIRYLIDLAPQALVTENNFLAVPVDTVMERAKPTKSRKKVVIVFGLYDDPSTARMLLTAQKRYCDRGEISSMSKHHHMHLCNLNWHSRKDALLVSYKWEPIPGSEVFKRFKKYRQALCDDDLATANALLVKQNKKMNDDEVFDFTAIVHGDDSMLPTENIMARLRRRGFMEIIRQIMSYI